MKVTVFVSLSLICLQIHAAKLLLLQEVNNLYSESSRTTTKLFKELSETFLLLLPVRVAASEMSPFRSANSGLIGPHSATFF